VGEEARSGQAGRRCSTLLPEQFCCKRKEGIQRQERGSTYRKKTSFFLTREKKRQTSEFFTRIKNYSADCSNLPHLSKAPEVQFPVLCNTTYCSSTFEVLCSFLLQTSDLTKATLESIWVVLHVMMLFYLLFLFHSEIHPGLLGFCVNGKSAAVPLEKQVAVGSLSPKQFQNEGGEQFLSNTSEHSTFSRQNNKIPRKEGFYCPLGPQYS